MIENEITEKVFKKAGDIFSKGNPEINELFKWLFAVRDAAGSEYKKIYFDFRAEVEIYGERTENDKEYNKRVKNEEEKIDRARERIERELKRLEKEKAGLEMILSDKKILEEEADKILDCEEDEDDEMEEEGEDLQ